MDDKFKENLLLSFATFMAYNEYEEEKEQEDLQEFLDDEDIDFYNDEDDFYDDDF